jgi:hypothetical protein
MHARSPLTRRDVVTPVNLYQQPPAGAPSARAAHLSTSPQVDSATRPQTDMATSQHAHLSTPGRGRRYTTYLRPDTIKALKRAAFLGERTVCAVVQAALDAYFAAREAHAADG